MDFNAVIFHDTAAATDSCTAAMESGASWGYFDYRRAGEPFAEGFQGIPADWTISSPRKRAFFAALRQVSRD